MQPLRQLAREGNESTCERALVTIVSLSTARKDAFMSDVGGRRGAPRTASERKLMIAGRTDAVVRLVSAAAACVPLLLLTAPAPAALGASYTAWACANAGGAPLSIGSWTRTIDAGLADVQATCAEPSAPVGAFLATARATSGGRAGGGSWILAAPRGTRITGLDIWWSWQMPPAAAHGAIRVYALGNTFLDPTGAPDPFDGEGRCCTDSAFVNLKTGAFGIPTVSNTAAGLVDVNRQSFGRIRGLDGRGATLVGLSAVCVSGCNTSEVVAAYQAYRAKVTLDDASPPAGKADGLRDGLRIGSGTAIDASASDTGGGVRELTLRVDGNVVQRVGGGGGCADADPGNADPLEYNLAKPCPSTLSGRLTLSTPQLPDAEPHTATVVATDVAGQDTILATARVARAAPRGYYDPATGFYNPDLNIAGPRKANGSNPSGAARLTLGFVRGHRAVRQRTIGYTTRPRIGGRLTAGGKPVRRARVWIASRLRGEQWRLSRKPLTTSRRGVVTARLPARSPSRDVRLVYFPASDRNANVASARRGLRVRATTTIQTDQGGYRNGDTLVFTGQVIAKRLIAHKTVYLQAIVRGSWRTFATTDADGRGRWRATHRFEATRRATRYTFRAVVPSQTGYAWVTGHSRSVRVLVTP